MRKNEEALGESTDCQAWSVDWLKRKNEGIFVSRVRGSI